MWRQARAQISVCARECLPWGGGGGGGWLAGDTSRLMKCKTSNHNHLSKHGYSEECDHSHGETVKVECKKECVRFKQRLLDGRQLKMVMTMHTN